MSSNALPVLKIIGACVLASILYGEIHDQVTIRLCPEYFTIWHPHLVTTDSLTILAMAWGVAATWLLGAVYGAGIAFAARFGEGAKYSGRKCVKGVALVLGSAGICAAVVGVLAEQSSIVMPKFVMGPEISRMSPAVQHAFAVDFLIHNTSYWVSELGGVVLIVVILVKRYREMQTAVA